MHMTFKEVILPAPGKQTFHARLYQNRVPPGCRNYQVHSHPAIEFGYFDDCGGVFQLKDRQYSIEPEDIFIFRSNEEHFVTQIHGDREMVATGLHFLPDFFWSHSNDAFDLRYIKYFSAQNKTFVNRLPRNSEYTDQIRALLKTIVKEFDSQQSDYGLMVKSCLISMLILVIRQNGMDSLDADSFTMDITSDNVQRIQQIMTYIDAHITEPLTLKNLAEVSNMSTSYFSQLFKKLNGFSTWDYIISKRVEMAQRMLIASNESIYNIALRCGFNNTTNFYKAFKKVTGVSPSVYRKN